MNDCIVYGLRAQNDTLYFYVGSTKFTAQYRLEQHIETIKAGRSRNRHFVNKCNQVGFENIVVDVLAQCTEANRFDVETIWIKSLQLAGHPLTNIIHSDNNPFVSDPIVDEPRLNIPVVIEAYVFGLRRNGSEMHDLLCDVIEGISQQLIEQYENAFTDMVAAWLDNPMNGGRVAITP